MHPVIINDAAVSIPRVYILVDNGAAIALHEAHAPFDHSTSDRANLDAIGCADPHALNL
jgi:hypothetical protein